MYKMATIIIHKDRAYLPVNAEIEGGPYFVIEPVFEANLQVDSVVSALEKILEIGHPKIPAPTKEEMKKRKDPILRATGTTSWDQLAKEGLAYTIYWTPEQVILYLSSTDKKGRFSNVGRTQTFSGDVTLTTIVEAVLEDINARGQMATS